MKLHYKITIVFSIVLILIVGGLSYVVFGHMNRTLEMQMGNNAMDIAITVAAMEDIQLALANQDDYMKVQDTIEGFRSKTRFQYIIVMDMKGIQYSYPYSMGIGKKYKNGGEEPVLENGESYISADRNVLISAIRAFTPVYYEDQQVGAVLVGLLTDTVNKENEDNRKRLEIALALGLVIGIIGASILSYNIKESIYGLEPKEIALLLSQRDLILQSIVRGIIAIDYEGKIILYNDIAGKTFGIAEDAVGDNIKKYSPKFGKEIMDALYTENQYNIEIRISSNKTILASYCVMKNPRDEVIGVVASFEDLSKAKEMAEELTGYKSMVNALRAQNHEFMNRLHTISGLIQLAEYDDALDYIMEISEDRAFLSGTVSNKIKNTHVAAILLAKYNRVTEAKIQMVVDKESNLDYIPNSITEDELCSIIGNLIENSAEALINQDNGRIYVLIKTDDKGISIIVKDNGPGIPEHMVDHIYERGISSKNNSRGLGLFIIKEIIDHVGGTITLINNKGVTWELFIPKE